MIRAATSRGSSRPNSPASATRRSATKIVAAWVEACALGGWTDRRAQLKALPFTLLTETHGA